MEEERNKKGMKEGREEREEEMIRRKGRGEEERKNKNGREGRE